jgi:hypothetical protein
MAQEPEPDDQQVDASHDFDLVPVFRSENHDAEMEAMAVQGVLEANGIPAVLVGPSTIPSLEFQVQVPQSRLEDAERALAEARAAGADAALEAERQTESGSTP